VPTGKFFPPDLEVVPVSQTIDEHQLVDEIIFKCTHTTEIGWMLPNIPPTGKRIEVPLVVIIGFKDGKVTHEHIYWDQASVLVQIGLLDSSLLPVYGKETASKMEEILSHLGS
jgi:carboxymethylenebutenolidase